MGPEMHVVVVCSFIDSLIVSQFTLLAQTKKGNKPDFHGAMGGDEAKLLYDYFFSQVQQSYNPEKVKNGVFQAMMEVALVNDGPVRGLLIPVLFNDAVVAYHLLQVTLELNAGKNTPA